MKESERVLKDNKKKSLMLKNIDCLICANISFSVLIMRNMMALAEHDNPQLHRQRKARMSRLTELWHLLYP